MIEIGMHQIYKNFGYKKVLNGVSFEIMLGNRVGIVGKNGAGKSTLFKLIMKKEFPDKGSITIRKEASIGYLEQIPPLFDEEVTILDVLMKSFTNVLEVEKQMHIVEKQMAKETDVNALDAILQKYAKLQSQFIALNGYEIEDKIHRVIAGFRLEEMLDTSFNILSGGQKTIVNLAALILKEPNILLLDEPTNHLDMKMIRWLEKYLSKYQGTVVIISHDRYFLDKVTNKTLLLEDGESHVFHGNYSYSIKEQEKILLQEFEQYKTQQKKITAMEAAIKRYRDWGNQGDNEKFFKKAKELEKRLDKLEILTKPQLEKPKIPIYFQGERSSNEVVKLKDFGISFDDMILFKDVNATMYYQEKIALLGDNGSGKSSLIKALLDEITNYEGTIKKADTLHIGYIPQEIRFFDDKETVLAVFRKEYPCLEGTARGILSKYGFYKDLVFKRVYMLSGGEKVLLKLAILMQQQVNFLILDEPTNHIDIDTREILEQALLDYQGTILFVSHDRYFIDRIANRIMKIEQQSITSFYGTYSEYSVEK